MGNMTTLQILQGIKTWVTTKLNLKQDVINDLANIRSGAQAGSTAVQPAELSAYFNDASYDNNTHRINFYHGQTVVAYVDASPFIIDGMVDDVRIENGYLVIDFNTESGKQDISIPLTDIFNPANYYNKTQTDGLLAQKQDVIQDLADIRSGASAGSTAVQPSTLNNAVKNVVAESGVYDVSANNDNTKFESLSALLSSANLNTLIPTDIRKGGMSIKFVLSSDNKYVQCRLMADTFSTTENDWQGVDEEPIIGSHNLVESGNVGKKLGYFKRTSEKTKNLFDPTYLISIAGWTEEENGVFSGILRNLHTNFAANNKSYPVVGGFKENTRYNISLEAMNTDSDVTGTGLIIKVVYTDNTSVNLASFPNSTNEWTPTSHSTAANKTVAAIRLTYGSNAYHVWKLRNIQLEEGTAQTSFFPFIQAIDYSARNDIRALQVDNINKPEINISTLFPTGGISGTNKYTLAEAIAKIPDVYKVPNITISFFNESNIPVKYRLVHNSFSTWENRWFECGITYGKFGYSPSTLNINTASNKIETVAGEVTWFGYGYRVIKHSSVGVLSSNIYATSSSLAIIISNGSEMIPIDANSPIADGYCVVAIIQTNYTSDLTQKQFKSVIWCGSNVTVDGKNYLPNGEFLVSRVADLEDSIDNLSIQVGIVPSYFTEQIQEQEANAVNDIGKAGVDGENFIFITDIHWESNARHSPALIKKITNDMCIGNIVFGGDAINGQADQDIARQYFNAISGGLSSGNSPFVAVFGNHDYNRNDGGVAFSNGDKTFYALFQKKNDYRIDNPTYETYFYFDNKAANVRHIILNYATLTSGSAQETWLTTLLNNTPNDTHIILYTHIYINTTSVYDGETWIGYNFRLEASAQVLNNILENTTKKVEAIIAGHLHLDYNGCTPSMIPVVLSDCDARQTMSGSQALGTKNEQAFDIVTTDFGNKKISCRRIGRGKSRIIHYMNYSLSVNDTLDISSLIEITPTAYSVRDNFSFQYRNAAGGGTGVTFNSTLASVSNAGVVTAIGSGIVTVVAENNNCIETFNIKIN